jgi:ATP-dependent DNA helicase RecG
MHTSPAQIDAWRRVPNETPQLEFKEAKLSYDTGKLFGYCAAIANEGGGHLILGVKNKPPREVVGTAAFQNPSKIAEKIFQVLRFRVDVEEVAHPSGRVLVFAIPSRPKGTAYHHEGQYLMRCGESLMPMSEDQLRRIFNEGKPEWLEEPCRTDLTEEEVVELLDVEKYFKLMHLPYPKDSYAALERLADDRLIDQTSDRYTIRRIAALLLAHKISEFPELERKAARVMVYMGKSKIDAKLTQIGSMGYAVGFQGLVSFVMAQMPQNEVIKNALRTETKLVPDLVIRELVANALIHQDFSETGTSVSVDIYSNRIDISNPGQPVVKPERFIDGYKSRNEHLADLMRRMGICEEKGCGIDRVVQTVEAYQLPAPSFVSDGMRTQVTIFGPKKVEDMDRADRVRACYQHCCLKYVMSERMTNQSLRLRFGLAVAKTAIVSQAISATVYEQLVKLDEKVGASRRFARYVPFWAQ